MKRITVTITDEQNDRLCSEAHRRRLSISELVREKIETASPPRSRVPGFLGLADKQLPYDSLTIDDELDKTFGRD